MKVRVFSLTGMDLFGAASVVKTPNSGFVAVSLLFKKSDD